MAFCSNCGTKLENNPRFCGSCGAATTVSQPSAPETASRPVTAPEPAPAAVYPADTRQVITALPQIKKAKFGIPENYTMVFTADSLIFAKLSNDVIKDVIRQSQAESKAAGKGWMGKIGDQMKAFANVHLRYMDMNPDTILAEDKANFAILHASISSLKLKRKFRSGDDDGPGEEYLEMEFETASEKYKYQSGGDLNEVVKILEHFYKAKIRS